MNCSAMRLMLRRAMRASMARPNGTWSAASTPTSSIFGISTPSKYSARCRATSSVLSSAGNTSTNRKSCVLNAGRDIAHSSMRSLHHDMRKTFDRWSDPSSASSRARAEVSPSSDWITDATLPVAPRGRRSLLLLRDDRELESVVRWPELRRERDQVVRRRGRERLEAPLFVADIAAGTRQGVQPDVGQRLVRVVRLLAYLLRDQPLQLLVGRAVVDEVGDHVVDGADDLVDAGGVDLHLDRGLGADVWAIANGDRDLRRVRRRQLLADGVEQTRVEQELEQRRVRARRRVERTAHVVEQ